MEDVPEGTTIEWTPYGKVRTVTKAAENLTIDYRYDAAGNRIAKIIDDNGTVTTNRYIRDASGNVMAVYQDTTTLEHHIYGSSCLGLALEKSRPGQLKLGHRQYELSNHLGNVLAVITDNVNMVNSTENSQWYDSKAWPTLVKTNDYYPFGLAMGGRTSQFSENDSVAYRYGFNGKEKDVDFNNHYDYGFRIYNPRIAKFLSVDPLTKSYPWNSPYAFAENDVIRSIDLEGGEKLIVNHESVQEYSAFFTIVENDEILRKTVKDPISNPELEDKIHIYLVQVDNFGAGLGTYAAGANYKFSSVAVKVDQYINFKNGVDQVGYTKTEARQDEAFFSQANLDPYALKSKIEKGIKVQIVAVKKRDDFGSDATFEAILHELYLHTRKFEEADNDADHLEGLGTKSRYSAEAWEVPESEMGILWKRFKSTQQKMEKRKNEK
ncbi:RHS repeat-associated core domain-containing protein [Marivirga tractuosa]|uniref:RHS repeat domain-containing protein n=1 Tax=Marivirga tractuosa TaxID=1006 RepID=UPI0035D0F9EE